MLGPGGGKAMLQITHHCTVYRQGPCVWRQPPSQAPPGSAPLPPRQDWPGDPPGAQAPGGWQEAAQQGVPQKINRSQQISNKV